MAKYNVKAAARGIEQTIKDYAGIRAERTKIMGDMLANQLKAKQNWFYKQKELDYQTPIQEELTGKWREQQSGGVQQGQPRVLMGQGGQPYQQAPSAASEEDRMKAITWNVLNKKKESGEKLPKQQQLQLDALGEDLYGIKSQYSRDIEQKDKLAKLKEKAASEGYNIGVSDKDSPKEQYANAVALYATAKQNDLAKKEKADIDKGRTKYQITKDLFDDKTITLDEYKQSLGALISKEKNISAETKKALLAVSTFNSQAEALATIEDNRDALELRRVDVDYIIEKIKEVLPEEYDPATGREKTTSRITGGKYGQLGDRKMKDGVWFEKQADNKWVEMLGDENRGE